MKTAASRSSVFHLLGFPPLFPSPQFPPSVCFFRTKQPPFLDGASLPLSTSILSRRRFHRSLSFVSHRTDSTTASLSSPTEAISPFVFSFFQVRIHSFLEITKNYRSKNIVAGTEEGPRKEKEILMKHVNSLVRKRRLKQVQKLLKKEEIKPWSRDTQAKIQKLILIKCNFAAGVSINRKLLTESAYVQPPLNQSADGPPDIRPAFRHKYKAVISEHLSVNCLVGLEQMPLNLITLYSQSFGHFSAMQKFVKHYGVIECDPLVLMGLDKTVKHMLIPYVPMLVPLKKWKGYDKGGHLFLPSYIMRTHGSRKQ